MKFSELGLPPSLAAALEARGYETATSVQAAVLDPACAERDLLVSSQTGSGKTVAFGTALAGTLLAGAAKVTHGPRPVALVVVPTRELAVQVREELGWLLQRTGLRLASFTGGTPVVGDLRALQRGVDLVIGTPGRLCDLLRRQRLELADVRVVVLDEADEMLDIGFREDLETLLKAAPATRRTLLLSATLPPEIQALARRFQRDALAIDPRKGGPGRGQAAAHDDINFVAHLVAAGDRLAAVINVLRAADSARAIVFCTTRDGVASMHAALSGRGFAATAISGERAQAERDRALERVRRGEASVLVATNVAARGLHLPDVDLIVHADLPLNSESLTHRSGRTGRAGRKGTAVLIASVGERRKAERLMMGANVAPVWTPAPSAETLRAAAGERLVAELLREAPPEDPGTEAMLRQLDGKLPAPDLLRRLLARELGRLPAGEPIAPVPIASHDRAWQGERSAASPRGARGDRGGASGSEPPPRQSTGPRSHLPPVLFRVNLGAKDKADPRWLLPIICRRGGVTRREVGAIRIGPHETLFEIVGDAARAFATAAGETDPRAPHVIMRPADGPQGAYGPQGGYGPPPPRSGKPPYKPQHKHKPAHKPPHKPHAKHEAKHRGP